MSFFASPGEDEMEAHTELAGSRVLIVEDEALVTMFLEDVLAEIGCKVAGLASRFQDAMEKARSVPFDVAILDVNLHGERTFPIAESLMERGTPFVFATGYGGASIPARMKGVPVLPKPFRRFELERALHAAMGR
jgi:DNA-binding response OmpR family regulator